MSIEHETLSSLFTDIADAIRSKTGGSAAIIADNFPTAISNINIHQGIESNKAVTITAASQEVTPSSGYKSMAKVTASVRAGSATPGADYATLSSAGSSATVVSSRYFKITPKVTVNIAGWISSLSNGTVQNYTIQAVEFEVSSASVKTKSGKAGWVDAATTVGTVACGTATVQS